MITQQQRLLNALKQGPVNSYKATYEMSIKQAPTRIKELRNLGYQITSMPERDRSVTWVLDPQGSTPSHDLGISRGDDRKGLTLEEQYIFTASGVAVPREQMEPVQEALI